MIQITFPDFNYERMEYNDYLAVSFVWKKKGREREKKLHYVRYLSIIFLPVECDVNNIIALHKSKLKRE